MQQKYPENVIVTVRLRNMEADVRLPTDSAFKNWFPELIKVLNQYRGVGLDSTCIVSYNERKLQSNDTLASLGAWDGSVLWLEKR